MKPTGRRATPRHAAPFGGLVTRLRRHRRAALVAAVTAALVLGTAGWGSAGAAFVGTTGNGTNSWSSGTVTFGANSPATALFTVTAAWPGSFGTSCVKLSYTGSLAAQVRLYVAPGGLTGSGAASYLSLQINEGSGDNADCSDFVLAANDYNATGTTDYTKTLAAFAGAATDRATGVSAWSPASSATRTYQFAWFLQPYNAAVSKSASVAFTWEALG